MRMFKFQALDRRYLFIGISCTSCFKKAKNVQRAQAGITRPVLCNFQEACKVLI